MVSIHGAVGILIPDLCPDVVFPGVAGTELRMGSVGTAVAWINNGVRCRRSYAGCHLFRSEVSARVAGNERLRRRDADYTVPGVVRAVDRRSPLARAD